MLKDIIQMSYLIIVAGVTLIIFIICNSTLDSFKRNTFLVSASISILMLCCNLIVYPLEDTGKHIGLLKLTQAVSYSISGPVVLPFIRLSGVIKKRTQLILITLLSINTALCFISIPTGIIFRISSSGNFSLGPLSPIPFYLSGFYLALLLYTSFVKYRLGLQSESIFITVLCVFIISATIMNTFLHFRFLISGMAILGNIFYYLFFTTQTLTRDALTNAHNRHSFYKDIEKMNRRQMFVISMDLNGLKQINDTLGHDEGDRAICAVCECTLELLPNRCRFYRMGGDEFEILFPDSNNETVENMLKKLKEAVEAKGYSVAVGFKEFRKGMKFEDVFNAADDMMYADKARMKNAQAASAKNNT